MQLIQPENLKTLGKPQEHIQLGHVGIILACAGFLIFTVYMRNGFHFAPISLTGTNTSLTFEQAKEQVLAENPDLALALSNTNDASNQVTQQQLALLDPSSDGSVLGASTEGALSAQELFSAERLQAVRVNSLGYTDANAVRQYKDKVTTIEANFDAINLLGNFSSQDNQVLEQNGKLTPIIISELTHVPVPTELNEYHRLKIVYYTTLQVMAEMQLGKIPDDDFAIMTNILFSIMDRMNTIRGSTQNKYQIIVP